MNRWKLKNYNSNNQSIKDHNLLREFKICNKWFNPHNQRDLDILLSITDCLLKIDRKQENYVLNNKKQIKILFLLQRIFVLK